MPSLQLDFHCSHILNVKPKQNTIERNQDNEEMRWLGGKMFTWWSRHLQCALSTFLLFLGSSVATIPFSFPTPYHPTLQTILLSQYYDFTDLYHTSTIQRLSPYRRSLLTFPGSWVDRQTFPRRPKTCNISVQWMFCMYENYVKITKTVRRWNGEPSDQRTPRCVLRFRLWFWFCRMDLQLCAHS